MFQSLISLLLASTLTLGSGAADVNRFDDSVLLSVSPVPEQKTEIPALGYMSAYSVLALDMDSQAILYERNSNAQVSVASLTKLMTAAIILDENNPHTTAIVSANAANTVGSRMGLYTGEEITVKNLLYGLLIQSGNDAAVALAEHNAGSVDAFVAKMNAKADKLGLENTHYSNPTGLDSSLAYSSAKDLALLSSRILEYPEIQEIVPLQSTEVLSNTGHTHFLESTNELLGQLGIKGLKTGRTVAAGECLISLAETPEGKEVLTIVLGSENRFGDTRTLLEWLYNAYSW